LIDDEAGAIEGYWIDSQLHTNAIKTMVDHLKKLKDDFHEKYSIDNKDTPAILFAVGDGNHSLATAKTHWENIKTKIKEEKGHDTEMMKAHPAR